MISFYYKLEALQFLDSPSAICYHPASNKTQSPSPLSPCCLLVKVFLQLSFRLNHKVLLHHHGVPVSELLASSFLQPVQLDVYMLQEKCDQLRVRKVWRLCWIICTGNMKTEKFTGLLYLFSECFCCDLEFTWTLKMLDVCRSYYKIVMDMRWADLCICHYCTMY